MPYLTGIKQDIVDIMPGISYFSCMSEAITANRLKLARVEKNLTQAELAERVGVTRQTIGLIEAGGYNPTLNLCLRLARETGKTLDELFWTDGAK
jgi:putative transcriptional regulator